MNALELTGITRRFGEVLALDDATLAVRAGTVHALLGENGAGKTTLMRIAYGMLHADAGTIAIQGQRVRPKSPADARSAGIAMVHQHFTVAPALTVAENIALGSPGRAVPREMVARARTVMQETGLELDPNAPVGMLSVSQQQRVEILKAVSTRPRVLILDEPTAVLAPSEIEELLAWIRRFAVGEQAVVLITHKLNEASAIADEVTVLRQGRAVRSQPMAESSIPVLVEAMLGEADVVAARIDPTTVSRPSNREVVRLDGVSVQESTRRPVRDVTCVVRSGELVGMAAVEGAGHHELLRIMAGRIEPSEGRVTRPDTVAFIPEDRHRDAVLLDGSLTENLVLRDLVERRGILDWDAAEAEASRRILEFDVRSSGPRAKMASLSGGNQQKFVLARELDPLPELVIAENPTRGLDVRATQQVHARLRSACASGAAVVVYSSDVDEVLALADRVFVMHAGRLRVVDADRERVGRAMLGLEATE